MTKNIAYLIIAFALLSACAEKEDTPDHKKASYSDLADCGCRLDTAVFRTFKVLWDYDSLGRVKQSYTMYDTILVPEQTYYWNNDILQRVTWRDGSNYEIDLDSVGYRIVKSYKDTLLNTWIMSIHREGKDTIWHYRAKETMPNWIEVITYENGNIVKREVRIDRNYDGAINEEDYLSIREYKHDEAQYVYCGIPSLSHPFVDRNNRLNATWPNGGFGEYQYIYDTDGKVIGEVNADTTWFKYSCE